MNFMPQPAMLGAPMPQPTPEQLEDAKRLADTPSWEEVRAILQSDQRRCYQVDIETDSTVLQDAEAEKMARMEYMQAMQQLLQTGLPAMQQNPSLAPLVKESVLFVSRAFKVGRTLEETLEEAFESIKKMPPQPSDMQMKIQAQKELDMQKMQAEQAKLQLENAAKKQQMAQDAQNFQLQQAAQAEQAQHERELKQAEMAIKQQEIALKQADLQGKTEDRAFARQQAQNDLAMRHDELGLKRQDLMQRQQDMSNRFQLDQQAASAKAQPANETAGQIQQLAESLAPVLQQISEQQQQIGQTLAAVVQQDQQMAQAVTAIASHMTAPRKIVRDPKTGRPVGVEVGENPNTELQDMLQGMTPGQRALQTDESGRIAGLG